MPERRCEEQSTLALAAVVAINRVYDAKNALDAAKEKKIDTELYEQALYDAQSAAECAVVALENHKRTHKCWGVGLPRSASGSALVLHS